VKGTGVRTITVKPGTPPTLEQAFADAKPGDTIVLAAGIHKSSGGRIRLLNSGTAENWIHVKGADGSRPRIDMAVLGEVQIAGSYVCLENVEIVNGLSNNLHIVPETGDQKYVIVRNCRITSLASGPGAAIKVQSNEKVGASLDYVYIENNDVSGSIDNAVIDGVGVRHGICRGNDVHDPKPGAHGIFYKGGSSNVVIEKNLVRGIRGNVALQIGGNTGAQYFDPANGDHEVVNQVVRNNVIVDCNDTAIEFRGAKGAKVYHNTIITQTTYAVFQFAYGFTKSGGESSNTDIDIGNNLVIATTSKPQYAINKTTGGAIRFHRNLWAGDYTNGEYPSIPMFPQAGDVAAPGKGRDTVVENRSYDGLGGWSTANQRFKPRTGGPAKSAGEKVEGVRRDILGATRGNPPSMGAYE
jgi:hypothetical protein